MNVAEMSLADAYAPVAAELDAARRRFDDELRSDRPFVNELCGRVKRYRGKMIRPALLLLVGRATGRLTDEHVTLAAVVEMVHVATLVHDDVLDEAAVRRRQVTVNAMTGNETAVLLGDYLISHAFHLCSSLDGTEACRAIGATTNRVCEGELDQIHHRGDAGLSEGHYLEFVTGKTAELTGTCCALGARFAGARPELVGQMRRFGTELGIAFQIVDDLLDLVGTEERVGKSLGRDLDLGKATLPVIHALTTGDDAERARLAALIRGDAAADHDDILEICRQTGSIEHTRTVASGYVARAQQCLDRLADSPARASLSAMADFVLRRDH